MSRQVSRILFVAALVLGIGGGLLHGQGDLRTTFEIPFEFQLNGRVYSAGEYLISHRSGDRHVTVRSVKTGETELVRFATRVGAKGQSSLVFDRNGNGRYLKEVHLGHFEGFAFREGTEEQQSEALAASIP